MTSAHADAIRTILEELLSEATASAVVMEALEMQGAPVPSSTDAAVAFVRGPLATALYKRLSRDAAAGLLGKLLRTLTGASKPPPAPPPPPARVRPAAGFHAPTHRVGRQEGPVRIVVAARTDGLADRLKTAFGGGRVAVTTASDVAKVASTVESLDASLLLIDAADPLAATPEELAKQIGKLREGRLCVVWSTGELYAHRLIDAAGAEQTRITPLSRREGVDPLLDMIRSQSSG